MTIDEAISIMNVIVHMLEPQYDTDRIEEAVEMAIKALEQQPTDAVDRVTIKEYLDSYNEVKTELEPCEDVVSRLAVLDALDKSKYSNEFCEEHHIDWSINLGMAHIVVNKLKPVTPQPKMGRWIEHFDESGKWYECDQCHTDWGGSVNYCPNCGAKM